MELFLLNTFAHLASFLFPPTFAGRLPQSTHDCRFRGHLAFARLMVLFDRPTTRYALLPASLSAYRVAYYGATRRPSEFSWGHVLIFLTVPSAHTLVRWVDE